MTAEELQAIRERADKATAGPWQVSETPAETSEDMRAAHEDRVGVKSFERQIFYASGWCERKNAAFIASAREDVPALVDELERLREACGQVLRDMADLVMPQYAAGYWQERAQALRAVLGPAGQERADGNP